MKPPIICTVCNRPVEGGGNYHPEHDPRKTRDRERAQEPYRRLYQLPAWQRTRMAVLARDPVCVECHRAASNVVDHINDHKGNTQLFFAMNNLRGVCKPCHDRKTGGMYGFGAPIPRAEGTVGGAQPASTGSQPTPPSKTDGPPITLPVAPEHQHLPDGIRGYKEQYGCTYVKLRNEWVLDASTS